MDTRAVAADVRVGVAEAPRALRRTLSLFDLLVYGAAYITPFGVQTLMYASPIVYPASLVPQKYQWLLALNPMAGIIDGWRSAILGKPWNMQLVLISTASSLVLLAIGVGYFRETERRFADIA